MTSKLKKLPKIAIIVLNWSGLKNTTACLKSLIKNKYPSFKIILVDNNSQNNEGQKLKKQFKQAIILIQNKENLGFAEGNNVGIRVAFKDPKVRHVLLLNNDTIVEKNFLEEIVKVTLQDPKIGMVAPKIFQYYSSKIDTLGIQLTKSGYGKSALQSKNAICPSGTAGLYSRDMLEEITINGEYLPAKFFLYYEDLDLGFRGRLAGYKFAQAPKAIVYHRGSAATGKMTDLSVFFSQRNTLWFILRCFPAWLLLINLPWIILTQLGAIALYTFKYRRPGIILKAKLASLKEICRLLQERSRIQTQIKLSLKEIKSLISPDLF